MTMTMSVERDKTGLRRRKHSGRSQSCCLLRSEKRTGRRRVVEEPAAQGASLWARLRSNVWFRASEAGTCLGCHEGKCWESRIQACICDQGTLMRGAASTPDFPASLKTAKL